MAAGFGQSRERAERLVALATILRQGRAVSFLQLREKYRLYGGNEQSARRAFERDKDELRTNGVDIVTVDLGGTTGYVVGRARFTSVTWSDEELDTLAVLTTAIGDHATGLALGKMAATSGEFPAEASTASIAIDVQVPEGVARAIAEGRQLQMTYRNAQEVVSERTIEPWDILYRNGLLYLAGWDPDAQIDKNFRIDRIIGHPTVGEKAVQARPEGPLGPVYPDVRHSFDIEVPVGERSDTITRGGTVLGEAEGKLHVRFEQARAEVMLGWALRTGATIRKPDEFADEQDRRAALIAQRHTGPASAAIRPARPKVQAAKLTGERLQRLLALPTWLGERAGATVADISSQFNCSAEEVEEDLELLDLVDIPGVGSIGEVERIGDQIVYRRFVEEPSVDLTAEDALRLMLVVQIGRAVLAEDEAPALTAIADRLRQIVPMTVDVELTGQQHPDLAVLKQALSDHVPVRFQYRGRRDTGWRWREMLPEQLLVANGAVYVQGTDVVAEAERMFRLDRLSDVALADGLPSIESVSADEPRTHRDASAESQEVMLLLSTRATWLLTQLAPIAVAATDDGGAVVVVTTDTTDWLLGHVRAAGGEAEIISPTSLRDRLAEAP